MMIIKALTGTIKRLRTEIKSKNEYIYVLQRTIAANINQIHQLQKAELSKLVEIQDNNTVEINNG